MATTRLCEVSLNTDQCEYPILDEAEEPCRTRCWSCGQRACKSCSVMRPWLGRKHRICNDCAGEYQEAG